MNTRTKVQKPADGQCQACKGTGTVQKDGKSEVCVLCRGGRRPGEYLTK